jgi:hypothetical protein
MGAPRALQQQEGITAAVMKKAAPTVVLQEEEEEELELLVVAGLGEQCGSMCAPKCLACAGPRTFTIALFMQSSALVVKTVST